MAAAARAGTLPLYLNYGDVDSPVVDAAAFANYGTLTYEGNLPFTSQNTLTYWNSGVLSGSDGFEFDFGTESSGRTASKWFYNNGSIEAGDLASVSLFGIAYAQNQGANIGTAGGIYAGYGSYILINATSITNSGYFGVGSGGLVDLEGTTINLAHSGIRTGNPPVSQSPFGGGNGFGFGGGEFGLVGAQFYSDNPGVTTIYGAFATNDTFTPPGNPLDVTTLFFPSTTTPTYDVWDQGFTNRDQLPSLNFPAWLVLANTNQINPSNSLVQLLFVNTNNASGDPNFWVDAALTPPLGRSFNSGGLVAIARFNDWDYDPITGEAFTNSVYLLDDLATITNSIYLTNSANQNVLKPSNLAVTRTTPLEWTGVNATNAVYDNTLLFDPATFVSPFVTNTYTAYSASVQESSSSSAAASGGVTVSGFPGVLFGLPQPQLSAVSNFSGRIFINANTLDLTDLRVRSVGPVFLSTKNIKTQTVGDNTNGTPMRIDSQWLGLDAASPVGQPLLISHYVTNLVRRMNGTVSAWSSTWTNYQSQVVGTNINTNAIVFYVTVVDQFFQTSNSCVVVNLSLHATEADIQDPLVEVNGTISLDVTNLTVSGELLLDLQTNFDATVLPKLQSLTVNGAIVLGGGGLVNLGGTKALTNFDNEGATVADAISIKAGTAINAGTLEAVKGLLNFQADQAKLDFSVITAFGDVDITGNLVKGQSVFIQAGGPASDPTTGEAIIVPGALNMAVTNLFTDGGFLAGNQFSTWGGFNLLVAPKSGQLQGTSITSFATNFTQVNHTWAGLDFGPDPAVFSAALAASNAVPSNAVLGQLTLLGSANTFFVFSGAGNGRGQSNALYVTDLEVQGDIANNRHPLC